MKIKYKMAIGSVLASVGGLCIVLGSTLGFTNLSEPWSFITGFVTGLICGAGTVLVISGLIENRKSKTKY